MPSSLTFGVFRGYLQVEAMCRRTARSLQRSYRHDYAQHPGTAREFEPCRAFEPLKSAWPASTGIDPYSGPGPRGERAITPGGLLNNTGPPVPLNAWKSSVPDTASILYRDPPIRSLPLDQMRRPEDDLRWRSYKEPEPVRLPRNESKPYVYKEPEPVRPVILKESRLPRYEPPEPVRLPRDEWKPPQAFGLGGPGEARMIGNEVERVRLDFGQTNRPYPHWNSEIYDADDNGVLSTKPKRRGIINDNPLKPQLPKDWWNK